LGVPEGRPALSPGAAQPPSLQAFAGIVTVSVGHCHPEVVKAVNDQNQLLQHTTTIYLNNQIAEYAKELADRMPGNLKVGCCCGPAAGLLGPAAGCFGLLGPAAACWSLPGAAQLQGTAAER
jgi:hypothetical protein